MYDYIYIYIFSREAKATNGKKSYIPNCLINIFNDNGTLFFIICKSVCL